MEFELLEGRVFGARYYTVQPLFEADAHTWFAKEWYEMEEWCVKTFGPTPMDGIWSPGSRWYANNAKFWFRNEKDVTIFLLKWG